MNSRNWTRGRTPSQVAIPFSETTIAQQALIPSGWPDNPLPITCSFCLRMSGKDFFDADIYIDGHKSYGLQSASKNIGGISFSVWMKPTGSTAAETFSAEKTIFCPEETVQIWLEVSLHANRLVGGNLQRGGDISYSIAYQKTGETSFARVGNDTVEMWNCSQFISYIGESDFGGELQIEVEGQLCKGETPMTPESGRGEVYSTNDFFSPSIMPMMWHDMDFCDLTVVATSGERMSCHSSVLSAASPVLKHIMLDFAGAVEQSLCLRQTINIDEGAGDLLAFLQYMYVGGLPLDADYSMLLRLMRLSDYYQVSDLWSDCESRLKPLVDRTNVLDVLRVLELFQYSHPSYEQVLHYVTDLADFYQNGPIERKHGGPHIHCHPPSKELRTRIEHLLGNAFTPAKALASTSASGGLVEALTVLSGHLTSRE